MLRKASCLEETDDADEQEPSIIIIKGNLMVHGNIINGNSDGAINLMVFGNLQ
jgi:hypothetical protein